MNAKKINVVKCFGCTQPLWTNNKELNKRMVDMELEYCYAKFKAQRYLFLNEVYQKLGIPCTRQGQLAGWVFDKDHAEDYMWTVWTKNDEYDDVYITFEPLENILDALPDE